MNKLMVGLTILCTLSGCSTLSTEWRFQLEMNYVSPDLKAAREAEVRKPAPPIPAGKSI